MPTKEQYQKHKEKIKKYNKQWKLDNKEKIKEQNKQWRLDNKEKIKEYNQNNKERLKEYYHTPTGRKSNIICNWKHIGIIDEDLGAVYDYYFKQTNCMICLKQFKCSRDRHLDHDHNTGEIRYICCRNCNTNLLREKYNN